ncbi:hypothetical protein O9G_003398 [Rozella allomycis CSF55]|uniref:Ndc10 domain-containing protein n=1 Tax=Rozella allomycis (strain CSF55) TaxID=988480 RepID=A0A075B3F9_ROZAC|nr:hypothetical protein O9G_003398 [Rozella allomycis CSF55]|eukprot:EPZ35506.1 hypothetical protein O9G_003398 [Rozella allomycis CSF55]
MENNLANNSLSYEIDLEALYSDNEDNFGPNDGVGDVEEIDEDEDILEAAGDVIDAEDALENAVHQQNGDVRLDEAIEQQIANIDDIIAMMDSEEYSRELVSQRQNIYNMESSLRRKGAHRTQTNVERQFYQYCESNGLSKVITKYLNYLSNKVKPNGGPLTFSTIKQHAFGLVRIWKIQCLTSEYLNHEGNPYNQDTKVLLRNHMKKWAKWRLSAINKVDVLKNSSLDSRYTMQDRENILFSLLTNANQIGIGIRDAFMFAFLAQTGVRGDELRCMKVLQMQHYKFHKRGLQYPGAIALMYEGKTNSGDVRESGILHHENPKVCCMFYMMLLFHYNFDYDKDLKNLNWTDYSFVNKLKLAWGKTKTRELSYRGHLQRFRRGLTCVDKDFGKAVHLARSNCCRDLQELDVSYDDIRIGLHWKGDVASSHYMNQLPMNQIIGSAGYRPDEIYEPPHLLVPVPEILLQKVFPFVETAMQDLILKRERQNNMPRVDGDGNGNDNPNGENRKSFIQTAAQVYIQSNDSVRSLFQKMPFCSHDFIRWAEHDAHRNAHMLSAQRNYDFSCIQQDQLRLLCSHLRQDMTQIIKQMEISPTVNK